MAAAAWQEELSAIARQQDPQVILRRSLDLARAFQTVGTESLKSGAKREPPPPELVLRRMCEELGATCTRSRIESNRIESNRIE